MKGSYILIIELKKNKNIRVGKLGEINFMKGFYAYVGSALNNLEKRIKRHLKKDKKLRWHIDYLLKHAEIKEIYYRENIFKEECNIASYFNSLKFIEKFGSSDCKCKSHLFYSEDIEDFKKIINKLGMKYLNKN